MLVPPEFFQLMQMMGWRANTKIMAIDVEKVTCCTLVPLRKLLENCCTPFLDASISIDLVSETRTRRFAAPWFEDEAAQEGVSRSRRSARLS